MLHIILAGEVLTYCNASPPEKAVYSHVYRVSQKSRMKCKSLQGFFTLSAPQETRALA